MGHARTIESGPWQSAKKDGPVDDPSWRKVLSVMFIEELVVLM